MGSSGLGLGAGQPHLTHGVTAVAEGREAAESLRPAISVVAGEKRVLLVDLARAEASVLPVFAARRAGALPRAAPAVREGRGAAAAVGRVAAEENPLEVEEAEVGEKE